ncbi:hypothetical protein MNBD_GAMMA11-2820 [hydrothermal vent metagenome]|uniref:Uncharacterized protein n=1 Tax=hydrothermal vent metagenome TaxID=652676 RepID=A0A3B0X5R5_9ZZZZ
MFILNSIEILANDLQNLPESMVHRLTFRLKFTIESVPDSLTGIVYANVAGELQLEHFNNPKGNRRKVITLKNKLVKDGFEKIKQVLFSSARGENVSLPQQIETLKKRVSGTPRK